MSHTEEKQDVYTRITNKIIALLEQGVRPWMKPWNAEHAAGKITRLLRNGEILVCMSRRGGSALVAFRSMWSSCEIVPAQAWRASVSLAAPSTFVMRLMLYAMLARPISMRAPDSPRISKRGCPKMRYLMVAKGCSTVHRRSLIIAGVTRSCIRFNACSYRWRPRPRLGARVQRDFSEQAPQSLAAALYCVNRSFRLTCSRNSRLFPGQT